MGVGFIDSITMLLTLFVLFQQITTGVDGAWSLWSTWGACDVSCGMGTLTRTRTCTDPIPAYGGLSCVGNTTDMEHCTLSACQSRHTVAFAVTTPNTTLIDGRPIFTRIITNVGGGYDPSTAKFTCPVTGLYHFTFRICSSGKYAVSCWIYNNGAGRIFAQTSADNAFDTSATSTYVQLTVGDVVYPGSCSNWDHVRRYYDSSFSGALIES